MKNIITRKNCLIDQNENLENLHVFKNVPVFMGCVDTCPEDDLKHDMIWQIDKTTGFIQLKELIPLDILYPEAHNAGAIGKIWSEHHRAFANFIRKTNPNQVLEIGGSHGILYEKYCSEKTIPWTIIDLNPIPIDNCKAVFKKDIFDENFEYDEDFDCLIHSHFYEHIYEPMAIMKKMASLIKKDKKMIFSVPNMQKMLEKKYSNCLNFEHTFFLTEPYTEYLLSLFNLKILEKEYFLEDHSIFYCVQHDENYDIIELPNDLYAYNKNVYESYVNYYQSLIIDINEKIKNCGPESIFLFGAHIFSQNLIMFGLDVSKIRCIIDNDAAKQGKRLYGTPFEVCSPNILKDIEKPIIVLKAGVYNEEIKNQINDLNSETLFYE